MPPFVAGPKVMIAPLLAAGWEADTVDVPYYQVLTYIAGRLEGYREISVHGRVRWAGEGEPNQDDPMFTLLPDDRPTEETPWLWHPVGGRFDGHRRGHRVTTDGRVYVRKEPL